MSSTSDRISKRPEQAADVLRTAFSLCGRQALITGASSGLGLAIAKACVTAGGRVIMTGRREPVLAEAAATLGAAASYFVHDVREAVGHDEAIGTLEERYGPIDILVNNAGIHLKKAADRTTEAEFNNVLQTHVTGAFSLTRSLLPRMTARGGGSILFMASMTSLIGMPQVVAYAAAKSAYLGMVRSLACEYSGRGIRVNAIAPGWIESPMLEHALNGDGERRRRILERTPMARFGSPEEIGLAAVFLSSPAASFITGAVLPVDGGASIGF